MTRKAFEEARRQAAEIFAEARAKRRAVEAAETAETLIEDRGWANARAWAEHCATRATDPLWRLVVAAIDARRP
jgi:uncharacterized membrane protein